MDLAAVYQAKAGLQVLSPDDEDDSSVQVGVWTGSVAAVRSVPVLVVAVAACVKVAPAWDPTVVSVAVPDVAEQASENVMGSILGDREEGGQ